MAHVRQLAVLLGLGLYIGVAWAPSREQHIGDSGGSLEPPGPLGLFLKPPGPLLTHFHTVYMAYSEFLPTRLKPLAERTCFSQVRVQAADCELHRRVPVAVRL